MLTAKKASCNKPWRRIPHTTNCYRLRAPYNIKNLLHRQPLCKPPFLMLCSLFSTAQRDWNSFLLLLLKCACEGSQAKVKSQHQESQVAINIKRKQNFAQRFLCPKEQAQSSCQVSACRAGLTPQIKALYHLLSIYNLFHLIPSMNFVTSCCILDSFFFVIYVARLLASSS